MPRNVVITGASAGVGRAVANEFARRGCNVGLIARNEARLETAAAGLRLLGVRVGYATADVADFNTLKSAASRMADELGPIDIWVNNAMATIFAPVHEITPEEFKRATEVTYLGQVNGTMVALSHMRPRNAGTIINVGSALAYRSVPLQSAYCGAKFAVRGFTDALRSELMHDRVRIHLGMVHLPAVNTPQFDWALNKMGRRAQPLPPIFQPEVPARAIVHAAFHHRREVWVGMPTVLTIVANNVAPGWMDRYLAKAGYSSQLTAERKPTDAPANLFETVQGAYGAHGRFDRRAKGHSYELVAAEHPYATCAAATVAGLLLLLIGRRSVF